METRELTCIQCPLGCPLTVTVDGDSVTVTGNTCPRGAVYVDNIAGEFGYCPPMEVEVVDTTGAGDAFFTAAVSALMNGVPLSQAVQEGTRLASRTVMVAGSCADMIDG